MMQLNPSDHHMSYDVLSVILDDDPSLLVDLALVEDGPDDELAQDAHRPGRLAPRDADPVDRRLAIRRRVERPTHALDRLGDRAARRDALRVIEGDVLYEVGAAGLVFRFFLKSAGPTDSHAHPSHAVFRF